MSETPAPTDDEKRRALQRLPAKPVPALLAEFLSLRARANKGEDARVPRATFHLHSGRDVTGFLLDYVDGSERGKERALLVHVPGSDAKQERFDVAYLDPSTVEALTVLEAGTIANVISFGKLGAAPGVAAPGRPKIEARLKEHSAAMAAALGHPVAVDVAWEGVPDVGEGLRVLYDLIEDTMICLNEIAADPMGKSALAEQIKKVWFGDGPRKAVSHQADTLVVTANLVQGLEGRLKRIELKAEIEKLL